MAQEARADAGAGRTVPSPSPDEGRTAHPPTGRPSTGAGSRELPGTVRAAAAIVAVEALALLGAAVVLLTKTVLGHPDSLARALLDAGFALFGAALLLLGARGLLHRRPAARPPVVVIQILALPVAYSLAFQAHRVAYGGPILVAALAVLYLLFAPPSRAALDRDIKRER